MCSMPRQGIAESTHQLIRCLLGIAQRFSTRAALFEAGMLAWFAAYFRSEDSLPSSIHAPIIGASTYGHLTNNRPYGIRGAGPACVCVAGYAAGVATVVVSWSITRT